MFNKTDLFKEKKQLLGYEVNKRFYEIGSFNGLKETEEYLKRRERINE